MTMRITRLDGGNTAFNLAAKLSLGGPKVRIWEHPNFALTPDPIAEARAID